MDRYWQWALNGRGYLGVQTGRGNGHKGGVVSETDGDAHLVEHRISQASAFPERLRNHRRMDPDIEQVFGSGEKGTRQHHNTCRAIPGH